MLVIEWPEFLKNGLPVNDKKTSVTVGVFDGVHRGHQALIERVVSRDVELIPVVVTFKNVFKKSSREGAKDAEDAKEEGEREGLKGISRGGAENAEEEEGEFGEEISRKGAKDAEDAKEEREEGLREEILSFQERVDLLERLGIKIVVVVDFDDEFRKMSGAEFLGILFRHCNVGFFAVGEDFRCGYKLDTDALGVKKFFAARGVQVEIVADVMEEGLPISSSRIRAAMAAGDIKLAQKMIGRL